MVRSLTLRNVVVVGFILELLSTCEVKYLDNHYIMSFFPFIYSIQSIMGILLILGISKTVKTVKQ